MGNNSVAFASSSTAHATHTSPIRHQFSWSPCYIHYWKLGICHQPALCHLPADGKERLCHLLIKNRWQRTDRRQRTWLPSANSLPSASGWQIIFAICQQMAKRLANPVAVKSVTAYQPHLFAICQQTAKILCHLLADGKEMGYFFLGKKNCGVIPSLSPHPSR